MLFDQVRELPVATVRRAPHSTLARFVGDVRRWWLARWQWFRPRTVPVFVAFLGMLGMLQAVDYLSPPQDSDCAIRPPAGSMMFIDGTPRSCEDVPSGELAPTGCPVRIVRP